MRQDGSQSSSYHWPALDGLRGIAVLAVILFHAFPDWTPNGFTGVDVFFGLSGFLITALLLRERRLTGRISLRDFYVRRLLRLYPALVAAVAAVTLLAVLAGVLSEFWRSALAVLLYLAHIWIYTGHDAWLLEHTWTLSLEEHYYLVWPAVLMLLLAGRRRRWLGLILGLGIVVLLATPLLLPDGVRGAYERGMPMIWGSAAALTWHRWPRGNNSRAWGLLTNASVVALALLVFWPARIPISLMAGVASIPGVLAVVAVVGFVLQPSSLTARLLTWPGLRWTGRRAYGLYLYHFPIVSVLTHQVEAGPDWARATLAVVLSGIVAAVSYRWIELPFLRMKHRFSPADAEVAIARGSAV